MTMCKPYSQTMLTWDIFTKIENNERPDRPQNMDDRLWEICTDCWKPEPAERATMASVVERFENPN